MQFLLQSDLKLQGEHKRTLLFENDAESNCDVLRTSHLNLLTEENTSQKLNICSARYMARIKTIIQLVPNFVQCP